MSKEFITIGICILSILASVVSAFITYRRIKQIDDLPEVAISAQEKEKYNETLTRYIYVLLGAIILNVINIFLPDGLLKFVIPLFSVIIIGVILSSIMEDADAYDLKKDDVEVYLEEQEKRKEEIKRQKELMEAEQKKRREARENMAKQNKN